MENETNRRHFTPKQKVAILRQHLLESKGKMACMQKVVTVILARALTA